HVALRAPAPRGEPDDMHAVGERRPESLEDRDASEHILGLVRDSPDPVGVVLARRDETKIPETEILEPAHDMRDIDEVLRLVEPHDETHPISSSTPNRAAGWRSPRSHTQPFP